MKNKILIVLLVLCSLAIGFVIGYEVCRVTHTFSNETSDGSVSVSADESNLDSEYDKKVSASQIASIEFYSNVDKTWRFSAYKVGYNSFSLDANGPSGETLKVTITETQFQKIAQKLSSYSYTYWVDQNGVLSYDNPYVLIITLDTTANCEIMKLKDDDYNEFKEYINTYLDSVYKSHGE